MLILSKLYTHPNKIVIEEATQRMHWASPSQVSMYLTLTDRGRRQEAGGLDYFDAPPEERTKKGLQDNGDNIGGIYDSWGPTRHHMSEEPEPTLKKSSMDKGEKPVNANIKGVRLQELSYTD